MQRSRNLVGVVVVLAAAFLTSAFTIVDSGHVGVVRSLGAVQPDLLPEGFQNNER